MSVNEDGAVYVVAGEQAVAFHVRVKRASGYVKLPLYLPTDKALHEDDGSRVYFHPACESTYKGQSEVLNAILKMANLSIFNATVCTIESLLSISANKDAHSKLPQPLMELVAELPTVSNITVKAWRKIASKATDFTGPQPMCALSLHRDKVVHDVKCARVAALKLPILDAEDLYCPGISKIANDAIRKAFELLFGSSTIIQGSNSPTAPYFTALIKAYHDVMSRISTVTRLLGTHMVKEIEYAGGWVKNVDKLHDWYRTEFFDWYEGNIGLGKDTEEKQLEQAHTKNAVQDQIPPQPQPTKPSTPVVPYQQPQWQPPKPPEPKEDTGFFEVPVNPMAAYQQPQYKPPPQQPQWQQPPKYMPPPPQPQWQQPQQPQQMEMYYDVRRGCMMPKGGGSEPPQQPQWQQPQWQPQWQQPQQPQPRGYDALGYPIW